MTSISKMELINRIKIRLVETKEDHNRLVKLINKTNKGMILKNIQKYERFEVNQITIKSCISELKVKLDRIIDNSHIKIINADNVIIEDVFQAFYNNEPPFSFGSKKYEFPDGFIIKSIEAWCKSNRKKMIVVTKDGDYEGYKSTRILFRHSLADLLEKITAYYDVINETQIIPRVKDELLRNRQHLLDRIEEEIDRKVILDTGFEDLSEYTLSKPYYYSEKITGIRGKYAEATYSVEIKYSFTVIPSINDFGKVIVNGDIKLKKIHSSIIIPCDIEIGLNSNNDIKIKWVNSNEKYRIQLSD
jgi:hypothetical protein